MAPQLPSCLLVVVLVLVGPASPGPSKDLNPGMTDQDLFWGQDQYDFSVVLHGSGQDCFWHFAHKGETFYLSFQVRPYLALPSLTLSYLALISPT